MPNEKVRAELDALGEDELLAMRESVESSPDGSTHEVQGVQLSKDELVQLINQALVISD